METSADVTPIGSGWPGVSVVMPVLDEERHLRTAVGTVLGQDYTGPLELVLALGPSRDRTHEIAAELAAGDPRVRTAANPTGPTGTALNPATPAPQPGLVVPPDGHALAAAAYLRAAV